MRSATSHHIRHTVLPSSSVLPSRVEKGQHMGKGLYRFIVLLAISLVAAACTSGSDPSASDPTTTTSTTSTTAAQPTTTLTTSTTAATTTTTTTEAPDTPDAQGVLDDVNAAMASQESFLGFGSLTITEAEDQGTVHATASLRGGQSTQDNSWIVSIMDVSTGVLEGTLQWEIREVDGVQYKQNPVSGEWAIDDEQSPNPVRDTLNGILVLDDLTTEETADGFRITGTYPEDPNIQLVELEVSAGDFLVSTLTSVTRQPRDDFAGIVPDGESDIAAVTRWEFSDYGIELTPAVSPPESTPTLFTRFEDDMFELQIPAAWNEAASEDIAANDVPADRLWILEMEIGLLVDTVDLVEEGIEAATLEEYVDSVIEADLTDYTVEEPLFTVNRQGEPIAILAGVSEDPDIPSMVRLVSLRDDGIGVNVMIVMTDAVTEANRQSIPFVLNSFLTST